MAADLITTTAAAVLAIILKSAFDYFSGRSLQRVKEDLTKSSAAELQILKGQIESDSSKRLAELQYQLRIDAAKREKSTSLLLERRAQVIADLYAEIVGLEEVALLIHRSIPTLGTVHDTRLVDGIDEEIIDSFFNALQSVTELHRKNEIYLPESICDQIASLATALRGVVASSIYADLRIKKGETAGSLESALEAVKVIPEMKKSLRNALRLLLANAEDS